MPPSTEIGLNTSCSLHIQLSSHIQSHDLYISEPHFRSHSFHPSITLCFTISFMLLQTYSCVWIVYYELCCNLNITS